MMRRLLPVLVAGAVLAANARAQEQEPADGPAFKLTTGLYRSSGGGLPSSEGVDANLRYSGAVGNLWVGWWHSNSDGFTQARAGWDRTFEAGPLRIQPSVQIASGGFRGGSIYLEAGRDWYAGAGLGRTNLRPYVNLNFDPNDAWTLAAGRRWDDGSALGLLLVGDNRENPDQRHLHLNWRVRRVGGERLTLDLLAKRGSVEGEKVRRVGASATYDWPRQFVRVAWDPKANFSAQDMLRLAVGARF